MKLIDFHKDLILASECENEEKYLKKKGIEVFEEDNSLHVALNTIWELAHDFCFARIRKISKLTQAEFSAQYGVPKRSVENWDTGVTAPPRYVLELLAADVIAMPEEK